MKDLHELPKLRDSISHLYIEHKIIEQSGKSIMAIDKEGKILIPVASLTVLMIGPGCSITHSAIKTLTENGCMAVWCGEGIGRFYAVGMGETRSSERLLKQAKMWANEESHIKVVKRMYTYRFSVSLSEELTLQQIRGLEGIRVREQYNMASKENGIEWNGRNYNKENWNDTDLINKALSSANACLYGICHAAIISLGYSPALGFVHTGKQLSFVYDIADLYKAEIIIPMAFQVVAQNPEHLEKEIRKKCLEVFYTTKLLTRIPKDIASLLEATAKEADTNMNNAGMLWDKKQDEIEGGINHGF